MREEDSNTYFVSYVHWDFAKSVSFPRVYNGWLAVIAMMIDKQLLSSSISRRLVEKLNFEMKTVRETRTFLTAVSKVEFMAFCPVYLSSICSFFKKINKSNLSI